MKPTTRTVECYDVPAGGGRTIRCGLWRGADGAPEAVAISAGWGTGAEWREDRELTKGEGLDVPAEVLPELVAALARLAERAAA